MNTCGPDFKIDAVATMDAKGQIVLPKDLRERMGLQPYQKIALVTFGQNQNLCCVLLIKTEKLEEAVAKTLSEMF
jgi:AbrB family looped-hinge helix DNA binding protein